MKFKLLEIQDSKTRQEVMHTESEKEYILYADIFTASDNQNNEFVIGLPLSVREWKQNKIDKLADEIKNSFIQLVNHEQVAVAIHNKKLDDEVHFHISYNGEIPPLDEVRSIYANLVSNKYK